LLDQKISCQRIHLSRLATGQCTSIEEFPGIHHFICRAYNINGVLPQISDKARKLDVSLWRFSNNTLVVGYYPYLAELILTRCGIEYIEPKAFMNVNNLLVDMLDCRVSRHLPLGIV
jgi:hypothetical protein